MTNKNILLAPVTGLLVFGSLLAALTGCGPAAPSGTTTVQTATPAPATIPAATVAVEDDYDYYPGYEVYYARNQHEYVYRDGSNWVRRPQPQGVTADQLRASPSVRVDFHDAPDRHHDAVVRSYPRNWKSPDDKDDRKKN